MKQLLFDLCRIGGVLGSEEPIAKFCAEKLSAFADTTIDKNGNVIATSEGYKAMKSCQNGIESVRKNAPEAVIEKDY